MKTPDERLLKCVFSFAVIIGCLSYVQPVFAVKTNHFRPDFAEVEAKPSEPTTLEPGTGSTFNPPTMPSKPGDTILGGDDGQSSGGGLVPDGVDVPDVAPNPGDIPVAPEAQGNPNYNIRTRNGVNYSFRF